MVETFDDAQVERLDGLVLVRLRRVELTEDRGFRGLTSRGSIRFAHVDLNEVLLLRTEVTAYWFSAVALDYVHILCGVKR